MGNPQPSPKDRASLSITDAVHRLNGSGEAYAFLRYSRALGKTKSVRGIMEWGNLFWEESLLG